ncbi:MAG TPA: L,D-transpeptidase [Actinomycetota bacterium]|nr:L,D-transpeptidase [Actinomycetota bacterium]
MSIRRVVLALAVSSLASCAAVEDAPVARSVPELARERSVVVERAATVAPRPLVETESDEMALTAAVDARRIGAFRRPHAPRPFEVFRNPNEYGYPVVFLVKRTRGDWLEVYLPIRPNGATGWVRARHVTLSENPFRIEVDLSENRLLLRRAERVVMRERVAVGTGGTPPPTGLFYTRMEHRTGDPGGVYGPFIQVLSAYSEVHFTFNGGNGEVGIHGTNDPSLLGQDVSNGCIRMNNRAITRLTRLSPVGTPVRIRA